MERDQLISELAEIVGSIVGDTVDPAKGEARLVDDLGADSMDVIDICDRIEAHFKISVDTEDVKDLGTFNDLVEIVSDKLAKAGQDPSFR